MAAGKSQWLIMGEKETANRTPVILTRRMELSLLRVRVMHQLLSVARGLTGNYPDAFRLLRTIREKYRDTFGGRMLTKASKVNGRYFWRLGAPGFPSLAMSNLHRAELGRFIPGAQPKGLRTVFLAITKKCSMNCRHCFEWDNLNEPETLTTEDLISIVHTFQDYGTAQVMFSGGEPLRRIDAVFDVLAASRPGTDFWLITSGLGMDKALAVNVIQRAAHVPDNVEGFLWLDEIAVSPVIGQHKP